MSKPDLVTQAFALLARYVDDEPCRLDHNGDCQTHGSEPPCRNAEARRILDEWRESGLAPVIEYGQRYTGGQWLVFPDDDELERIYPTALRIEHGQRFGGVVGRRTVIVLKDWKRLPRRRRTDEWRRTIPQQIAELRGHGETPGPYPSRGPQSQ